MDVGRAYEPVDHRRARRGRWRAAGSAGATAPGQRGYEREQGKRNGLAGPILLEQVHGDATRPAPGLFPETHGTGGMTQARKVDFAQASLHSGGNNRCAGPVTPPDAVPTRSPVSSAIEVSSDARASSTAAPCPCC